MQSLKIKGQETLQVEALCNVSINDAFDEAKELCKSLNLYYIHLNFNGILLKIYQISIFEGIYSQYIDELY